MSILVYGDHESGGLPADRSYISSVNECHAGDEVGKLTKTAQPPPALLCAHGQLVHQTQPAGHAEAVSGLHRASADGRKG